MMSVITVGLQQVVQLIGLMIRNLIYYLQKVVIHWRHNTVNVESFLWWIHICCWVSEGWRCERGCETCCVSIWVLTETRRSALKPCWLIITSAGSLVISRLVCWCCVCFGEFAQNKTKINNATSVRQGGRCLPCHVARTPARVCISASRRRQGSTALIGAIMEVTSEEEEMSSLVGFFFFFF